MQAPKPLSLVTTYTQMLSLFLVEYFQTSVNHLFLILSPSNYFQTNNQRRRGTVPGTRVTHIQKNNTPQKVFCVTSEKKNREIDTF